jgi:hypothetical protein
VRAASRAEQSISVAVVAAGSEQLLEPLDGHLGDLLPGHLDNEVDFVVLEIRGGPGERVGGAGERARRQRRQQPAPGDLAR